jgi:hypothetical protein
VGCTAGVEIVEVELLVMGSSTGALGSIAELVGAGFTGAIEVVSVTSAPGVLDRGPEGKTLPGPLGV